MIGSKHRRLLRQGLIHHQSANTFEQPVPVPHVPETPVLQFHVLGADIVVFVIREGGVQARVLRHASADVAGLLQEWQTECSRMRSVSGGAALEPLSGVDLMHAFYKTLIEPVADLLADLEGEPLMVVPHQHLFGVPFEAIDCEGIAFSEQYSAFYCAGTAADGSPPPAVEPRGLAVFAVPDGIAPQIEDEARAIAGLVPDADVLLGNDATAAAFVDHAVGKDVVHIACHGEFREGNPLFSGIRLADRWMTGAEVMSIDLHGTMVILSACDAGRSSDVHIEPVGLVWAFLAAGARSVIAAKWAVDDAAGAVFMTQLHGHLAHGLHPRQAVDLARREVRSQFPHPYYWAAYRYICSPAQSLLEEEHR